MRGHIISAFVLISTGLACGSQYDDRQPQFARDQTTVEALDQVPSQSTLATYIASEADLSQDAFVMASEEMQEMTAAMTEDSSGAIRSSYQASGPAAELQAKLAACNLDLSSLSWNEDSQVRVRDYNFNVTRLQRSQLIIPGSGSEIVFVNIQAQRRIARVDIALTNPKATYCLNVSAGRVINRLSIAHSCQARLGVVNIEAGVRARNVQIAACL